MRDAETPDTHVLSEFAYAIPAGMVIAFHLLTTLAFVAGAVPRVTSLLSDDALLVFGLLVSLAGGALSVRLWLRRSWLVLLVPIATVPIVVAVGMVWGIMNWGGH